ncbi:MAG TPA: hypothetical protein DHV25_03140 [Candidatus Kerfeldbacteria bacterium]|nr:hypothetical protein [Candidatus Kerfeldbacteria bacterium]
MNERTVMVMVGEKTFVGKLQEDGSIENACLCTFAVVPVQNGVGQLAILRKLGKISSFPPSILDNYDLMIDLETDTDIYAEYVRLTTGIETTAQMPRGPSKISDIRGN